MMDREVHFKVLGLDKRDLALRCGTRQSVESEVLVTNARPSPFRPSSTSGSPNFDSNDVLSIVNYFSKLWAAKGDGA